MKPNYGKLIDPERYYPVNYTITQDGKKIVQKSKLLGKDLTENQIRDYFLQDSSSFVFDNKIIFDNRSRSLDTLEDKGKELLKMILEKDINEDIELTVIDDDSGFGNTYIISVGSICPTRLPN
jgi:hypothetical protein